MEPAAPAFRGAGVRDQREQSEAEEPGEAMEEFQGRDGGQWFQRAEWTENEVMDLPLEVTGGNRFCTVARAEALLQGAKE